MFGFFMVGAVVGFCAFYFLRQLKQFNPAVLAAFLGAAIFGPVALKFLKVLGEDVSDYFAGFGVGFFLYAVYVLIIMVLARLDIIEETDVELFAASGAGPRQNEDARELYRAIEEYVAKKITKQELIERAKSSGFSKRKYEVFKRVADQRARTKSKKRNYYDLAQFTDTIDKLGLEKELR